MNWRYWLWGRRGKVCPFYKPYWASTWGIYCYCGFDPDVHSD